MVGLMGGSNKRSWQVSTEPCCSHHSSEKSHASGNSSVSSETNLSFAHSRVEELTEPSLPLSKIPTVHERFFRDGSSSKRRILFMPRGANQAYFQPKPKTDSIDQQKIVSEALRNQKHGKSVRLAPPVVQAKFVSDVLTSIPVEIDESGKPVVYDAHFHPFTYTQECYMDLKALYSAMYSAGIRGAVLMPLPTTLTEIKLNISKNQDLKDSGLETDFAPSEITVNVPKSLDSSKNSNSSATLVEKTYVLLDKSSPAYTNRSHCGPSYYIPKELIHIPFEELTHEQKNKIISSSEVYLDTAVDHELVRWVMISQLPLSDNQRQKGVLPPLTDAELDAFDLMITGLHLGSETSTKHVLKKVASNERDFTGMGELTIHKEFIEKLYKGDSQANLTNRVEHLKNILGVAGVIGMSVTIHCDIDSIDNQENRLAQDKRLLGKSAPPQHLENFKKLLLDKKITNDNWKTTIIWAHAGGLGRWITQPPGHTNQLSAIFDNPDFNHVMIDISWDVVAQQLTGSAMRLKKGISESEDQALRKERCENWIKFMNKYSDRILFGSDAVAPANIEILTKTFEEYKPIFDRLSLKALIDITQRNYKKCFIDSRAKVRDFKDRVLTPEFENDELYNYTSDHLADPEWLFQKKQEAFQQ